MLLTTLLVLTTLLPGLEGPVRSVSKNVADLSARLAPPPRVLPVYEAETRVVSNWQFEAGASLQPTSLALVARYATAAPAFVARCVKLNNYWCIKRARWSGEIGGDTEGHTGFATASDGADAAAQLLRRYYREYERRTALSIVRRWAPAECRIGGAPLAGRVPSTKVATDLAPRGINRTLRARFLARHPRGGASRPANTSRGGPLRVQPWSPLARMARPKAPQSGLLVRHSELLVKPSTLIAKPSVLLVEPAAVLGQSVLGNRTLEKEAMKKKARLTPVSSSRVASDIGLQERFVIESAQLPPIVAGSNLLDLSPPTPLCGNDETRIRNYAARIAASVGLKVEDDLKLFGPEGQPLINLQPVMLAMSSVELGTLRASPTLVGAAMARMNVNTRSAIAVSPP
ncbi:hypothetical protein ASF57_15660 [Methylobacterium sp. Leaf117]|nr:hypothetical protein [Methylobacterium sp. Leaf117]KQP81035.1 hypothetical protein ASF57_15660 [Methylobacterium sp. Leaf117]